MPCPWGRTFKRKLRDVARGQAFREAGEVGVVVEQLADSIAVRFESGVEGHRPPDTVVEVPVNPMPLEVA